jgi:spore germination cell wall hydrolase CwlJ-like protein
MKIILTRAVRFASAVLISLACITPAAANSLYDKTQSIKLSHKDLHCLARNVFHEAGGESYTGKIAVAQVTWNRVVQGTWGSTVCSVVHSPHQFSWTRQNKSAPAGASWRASYRAAQDFLSGVRVSGLDRSLYFHSTLIPRPAWTRSLTVSSVIGQHRFYHR